MSKNNSQKGQESNDFFEVANFIIQIYGKFLNFFLMLNINLLNETYSCSDELNNVQELIDTNNDIEL